MTTQTLKNALATMLGAAVLTMTPAPLAAQVGPVHFNDAVQLIADLNSNPLNTNVYNDGGMTDVIEWTGNPRKAITVCGTFMTMLMKRSYGLTDRQFSTRTGSKSPNAAKWHDAVAAGSGFTKVTAVDQMQTGDVIAIKYPAGENSSGHVMMAQAVGALKLRGDSTQNFLDNGAEADIYGYYDVTVIDSSSGFHGASDSRAAKPGGIGRDGVFRIYVNSQLQILGYTWSDDNGSAYKKITAGYALAMGRIVPATW